MLKRLERLRSIEDALEKSAREAEAEAASYQPLFEAFQAVREATANELGLTGRAFYREWAERICRAGKELGAADLLPWLAGAETSTDPAEGLTVEIYQLGVAGKKEEIVGLLMETFELSAADADNQTKIRSRGAVNGWLRRRLADKLWDWLYHKPTSPLGEAATATPPGIAKPHDDELSDRQCSILETMLAHAITSERRRKTRGAVVELINRTHKAQSYNRDFATLSTRGYLQAREGHAGGVWLTRPGIATAQRLSPST